MSELFTEMERRYRDNGLPWNQTLPPPEVIEITEQLSPGRMLDLGCGLGRASIYMAKHGWKCDGVDFIPQAIGTAQTKAAEAGVADHTRFFVSSVANLDFLQPFYDFALDVGCLHGQTEATQAAYANSLSRLLRVGGIYLLFARLQETSQISTNWPSEEVISDLFSANFTIERVERGTSDFGGTVAPSAWFWLQRNL